jgi:hypothetical protein
LARRIRNIGSVAHQPAGFRKLGQPMRAAPGGGEAIICLNVNIGGQGTWIDIPLAHLVIDHPDTVTVSIADAPRPEEIVVVIAISDGGRSHPRVGKGRV